ncbi:MAG: histidinol dehydrogenase [Clostridia bacterium]|nr:histidinol dehydrogenase [Deltaproteobacteria bacterium]
MSLRRIQAADVARHRFDPVDDATRAGAGAILNDVRNGGQQAVRAHAERLGDIKPGEPLVYDRDALKKAAASLSAGDLDTLKRTADRIAKFAMKQLEALKNVSMAVDSGEAGHEVRAMHAAGCYAPGGRFPLPSSVLMTAVTARVARVPDVWVASPKPVLVTLAAAHVADADALLAIGGAQAIGAFTYGAGICKPRDVIAGPGNRWVTAAKQLVAGQVAIDMLAGPSELVVIADESARADVVASDLLAQAEHDTDALPILITTSAALAGAVDVELVKQLATLPTRSTAEAALRNGFCVIARDIAEAAKVSNELAPEHLELQVKDADGLRALVSSYGALFVGTGAAEVFGDYGVGPNHVLPTGGSSRFTGGLSVLTFLRVRTWLTMEHASPALIDDVARLARLEGLEAHARAAEMRRR